MSNSPRCYTVPRAQCPVQRPCPRRGCRYHLWPDVRGDRLRVASCALDLAERGGILGAEIADLFNLTRERIRQLIVEALEHARTLLAARGVRRADFHVLPDERPPLAVIAEGHTAKVKKKRWTRSTSASRSRTGTS